MHFYYEILCPHTHSGVRTVKLNGKLIYFAALNAFQNCKGNLWRKAKRLVNTYIKGVSSSARLTDAIRLLTFIALNKEFGVNNMMILPQQYNNCYTAYGANLSGFHFFGVCSNRYNLCRVLHYIRNFPSISYRNNHYYAATFDVIKNTLTIIDPPSENNECIDIESIYESERNFRKRLHHDFKLLDVFEKKTINYEGECYEVIDFPDISLRVGLNVKFIENNIAEQYILTENIIISNGIYIEQLALI